MYTHVYVALKDIAVTIHIHMNNNKIYMYTKIMKLIMQPPILFLHECT